MQRRQWGRVLWMAPWPVPGTVAERHFHWVASTALPAWLPSVAAEVARETVTLNVLKPGPLWKTAGAHPLAPAGEVTVSEVAAVATFLLSDPARGLCGRTIELGAAASLHHPGRNAPRCQ